MLFDTTPGPLGATELVDNVQGPPPPPEIVRPLVESTVVDLAAMQRGFEILAKWSSVDRLGQIRTPTFIGNGRPDMMSSAPQAERIGSGIPGSTVHVFENSGHMPWIDEPDACFETLRSWLDVNGY